MRWRILKRRLHYRELYNGLNAQRGLHERGDPQNHPRLSPDTSRTALFTIVGHHVITKTTLRDE